MEADFIPVSWWSFFLTRFLQSLSITDFMLVDFEDKPRQKINLDDTLIFG